MKSIEFLKENGVDIDKSLEFFGDEDSYNENVVEYLVGIHNKVEQLVKYLQNDDLANYSIYVHSLKSDSKYYGFDKLSEICLDHEMKSKANDSTYIKGHFLELVNEANRAISLLKEYIGGEDGQNNASQQSEGNSSNDNSENEDSLVYNSKTILVVDDSNIIRNFVKRIFSEEYNVGSAEDGLEAIKIIEANKDNDMIEAILLDLNMPKLDGFGVLDYLKDNNLLKTMPVSIISGDSTKETIDRAFTYEIVDMLSKPFNDQNVKMVIEKTLIYKGAK